MSSSSPGLQETHNSSKAWSQLMACVGRDNVLKWCMTSSVATWASKCNSCMYLHVISVSMDFKRPTVDPYYHVQSGSWNKQISSSTSSACATGHKWQFSFGKMLHWGCKTQTETFQWLICEVEHVFWEFDRKNTSQSHSLWFLVLCTFFLSWIPNLTILTQKV